MKEISVNSWNEFETRLNTLRTAESDQLQGPILFRGQGNACWPLCTTLDRKYSNMRFTDYYRIIAKIRSQIETL